MVFSQFLRQNSVVAVLSLLVMGNTAVLPLVPAAGWLLHFSLQWKLGNQHSICKTLNDLAIKVVFSAIFQEFQGSFFTTCA